MESQHRNNLLTRESAWWYIPKEHVHALRVLEDKLNDLVYTNGALKRDDALKTLKNELSVKDKENAEKILGHFIRYYEMSNKVLYVNDESLALRIKCEIIGAYKEDFANACIILYRLLENKSGCVGKSSLHAAMNNLIDPNDSYRDYQHGVEKYLEGKYKDRFKEAINILLKAKLAVLEADKSKKAEVRQSGGRIRNSYRLSQNFLDATSDDDVENIYVKAIQKLRNIRLETKTKGNTATNKKEIRRILDAKEYITERLSTISIASSSDRTVLHWFCVFLVMKYAHVDTSRVMDDIITYIRYNNIKATPIPVTEKKLSRWEESYTCWSAFESLLVEETSIPVDWSLTISDEDYADAAGRLINDMTEVSSSFDSYLKNMTRTKGEDDKTIIGWIENIMFSLLYVRATIELNSSHNDASGHLEHLFKVINQKQGVKNGHDLCLVVSKLNRLVCEDTFEYSSKARKWLHALNNIHECTNSFDAQNVSANIYLHLIGMSGDEGLSNKYRRKCSDIIRRMTVAPGNVNQLLEVTVMKYLYLLYTVDSLGYKEVSEWILDLWENIAELFKMADSADPRLYILKYDTFIIAAKYLNKYLDFGFSLPLLTIHAYMHLKELRVKNHINYYYLLEGLGEFIEQFEPEVALRVKMQIEPDYPNKLYIDREIAIQLFDKGYFDAAFEYAKKAGESFNKHNLTDIEGLAYYIDTQLIQVNALFLSGEEEKAEEILLECGRQLSELDDLYPDKDRSCILQGVIDHYNDIKAELDKRPFYSRELRLDYVLTAIYHMDYKTDVLEDFYDKWSQFNVMYMFHREFIDKTLQDEFESDKFPAVLEDMASEVVFSSPEFDLSPIDDDEIRQLKENLEQSYGLYQRTFLPDDDNDEMSVSREIPLETPSFENLFELFQPKINCKAYIAQQKALMRNGFSQEDNTSVEELEKYHYVVTSDCSSANDALEAANLFMQRLESAAETTYVREMAAEVLCRKSSLIDFEDWSEQERLLNKAESFIMRMDGSLISDRANEIYIRIAHRLCDLYEYQLKDGVQDSLMVDKVLDLIKTNDIRTTDAAWFLGERAQNLVYDAKKPHDAKTLSEAGNMLRQAIDILESIFPQTDESQDYLELYRGFLSDMRFN